MTNTKKGPPNGDHFGTHRLPKASPVTSISPWKHPLRRPSIFKSSKRPLGNPQGLPTTPRDLPTAAPGDPQDAKKEPQDTGKSLPSGLFFQVALDPRTQAMFLDAP